MLLAFPPVAPTQTGHQDFTRFILFLMLKVWGGVRWCEAQISHCVCRQCQPKLLESRTRTSYKREIKFPLRSIFKVYEKR